MTYNLIILTNFIAIFTRTDIWTDGQTSFLYCFLQQKTADELQMAFQLRRSKKTWEINSRRTTKMTLGDLRERGCGVWESARLLRWGQRGRD